MEPKRQQININGTIVFEKNFDALFNSDKRFIVNQGSSRSSKTISICQLLIVYALKNPKKNISIVRKSFPALRATAMKDFIDQLRDLGIYKQSDHQKTTNTYTFNNGTVVSFFSVDDEQKLRGRQSNIVWANESNELYKDDFDQLNLRCEEKMIFDFNPSDSASWIYDLYQESTYFIKSTYKDNPFIAKEIIKQIENYKITDPELYEVFGLGNRINGRQNIYTNWEFIDQRPDRFTEFVYGIDYGFVHPSALVKVWYYENEIYVEELMYESYLTSNDIVGRIDGLVERDKVIVAEVARPEINADIQAAGYSIINADKSIKAGINAVKTFKVYINSGAKNLIKEYQNYKWKKQGDHVLDEPIKVLDDGMDGIRYATLYIKNNLQGGQGLIFN